MFSFMELHSWWISSPTSVMFTNFSRLTVVLCTFLSSTELYFLLTLSSGMFTLFFTEAKFLSTGHSDLGNLDDIPADLQLRPVANISWFATDPERPVCRVLRPSNVPPLSSITHWTDLLNFLWLLRVSPILLLYYSVEYPVPFSLMASTVSLSPHVEFGRYPV